MMNALRHNLNWLAALVVLLALASPDSAQVRKQLSGKRKQPAQAEELAPETVALPLIPGLRATLTSSPKTVEVGEPMIWSLEIHHPRELMPILPGEDLGLGPHWIVLEDYGAVAEASPDGIAEVGFWITRKRWQVMAIAPHKLLPSMEIFFGEGEGAYSVMTSEAELAVKTVLGPGEQFARTSKGFRDPDASGDGGAPPWWMIASGVTLLLGLGWWLFARRGEKTVPEQKVAPLAQLDSMGQALPDDLQAIQSLHYSLTALIREATDERLGQSNTGTTDGEWLELVRADNRIDGAIEEQLAQVIQSAESVKYARVQPTRWAVEETIKAARGALEGMQQTAGGAR